MKLQRCLKGDASKFGSILVLYAVLLSENDFKLTREVFFISSLNIWLKCINFDMHFPGPRKHEPDINNSELNPFDYINRATSAHKPMLGRYYHGCKTFDHASNCYLSCR